MSKVKKVLSIILTIALLCSSFLSTAMIAHASLLPLKEVKAQCVLSDYEGIIDVSKMPIKALLQLLMDKNGNFIDVDLSSATMAWKYVRDTNDGLESYEPYILDDKTTIDLTRTDGLSKYTLELIVGNDGPLNKDNVRYIITVYTSDVVHTLMTYELYTQKADGQRVKVEPKDVILDGSRTYWIPEHIVGTEYYLGINSTIDDHPYIEMRIYLTSFFGGQIDITDQILNQDMTKKDAGFKGTLDKATWDTILDTKYFRIVLTNSTDGSVLYNSMKIIDVAADVAYVEGEMLSYDNGVKTDVAMWESNNIYIETEGKYVDGIHTKVYMLNKGLDADDEYHYALNAHSPVWSGDANRHVAKAVVGLYETWEDAASARDIQDQLILEQDKKDGKKYGYKANYNDKDGGQNFTVFFKKVGCENDTVFSSENTDKWMFNISVIEYKADFDSEYVREFTDKPIVGEADPWFRVTGATDNSGKAYDTYVIENGKNINMDTYYGYGYQTVFVKDASVDLSKVKPEFWYANTNRVYAVSKDTGNKVIEGHTRDFRNENQQYTGVVIDTNGKENERNYWVTFKTLNNKGPELFVYGPDSREVILDEYFEFKHDILIANIGNAPLEDINVKLLDAENVKLDPYWTVGGKGNDTLAAFTTTSTDAKYGELANLAKIRLLPDGDGEVKGTLVITAKGQDPVMITLNGTAQNPEIITETLDDAVKYVPYQHIIATNNMHDWVETTFSISEGQLPDGITLNSETGEIYGVPSVPNGSTDVTYSFTVEAEYLVNGQEGYFDASEKEFTITVNPNTDENVYLATDDTDGYFIQEHIGTEEGQYHYVLDLLKDTVFKSNGEFGEFKHLWLNGEKLIDGVDYIKEEGSTKITVMSQTFENKTNAGESNTIAMEFRNDDNEMNRTSQNFVVKEQKPAETAVDKVIAKIKALPTNITLNDKSVVQEARNAYNALSNTEKTQVTNYNKLTEAEEKIKSLEAVAADKAMAEKVIAKIKAIPSSIDSNAKDEIVAARTAYDSLTAAQKSYVTNYDRLVVAENALKQFEAQQADKAAANSVIALISTIPSTITSDAKDKIQAARTAYNSLTEKQKSYVTNYDRLVAAENALKQYEDQQENKVAANRVIALISAIPSTITSDAKDEIVVARTAYDALTDTQKSFVTNYDRLVAAEEALQKYESQQADKAAANSVVGLISAIPSTITSEAKNKIQAARTAYDALSSTQKSYVTNYDRLVAAEEALRQYEEQQEQISKDKAAAGKITDLIDAIPSNVTLDDKFTVNQARAAYNTLTAAQKSYVTNYSKLTAAEEKIIQLEADAQEKAEVNSVIAKIDDLPENLKLEDKQLVKAARTSYEALSSEQKAKVINYEDLLKAEKTIEALEAQEKADKADKEASDTVSVLIAQLPENITLSDKPAVENARSAYDQLTEAQKKFVVNYSKLTDAEKTIQALEDYEEAIKADKEAADNVINLINSIPADVKLEDKPIVETARNAYDALTEAQKKIVTNYEVLADAEVKIAELEDEQYEEVKSVTLVGILLDQNGEAYADTTVEIHSVVQTGITDKNGSFQFNNVELGEHILTVKDSEGNAIAEKEFSILSGSPISLIGDDIIAQDGSVFTVMMKMNGDSIDFLSIEEGNRAPEIDNDEDTDDDDGGIDIGGDDTDIDNDGDIDIGDDDTDNDEDGGIDIGDDDTENDDVIPDDDGGIDIGDDETPEEDEIPEDDGIDIGEDDSTGVDTDEPVIIPDNDSDSVEVPDTGDSSNIVFWTVLLAVSLMGLAVTAVLMYREKNKAKQF